MGSAEWSPLAERGLRNGEQMETLCSTCNQIAIQLQTSGVCIIMKEERKPLAEVENGC